MKELTQLIRGLAALFWQYSTFQGSWRAMPESVGLCLFLGVVSLATSALMGWIEYGWMAACVLSALWIGSVWLIATDGGRFDLNKRLASATFLLVTPFLLLLAMAGKGHLFIEAIFGAYLSAAIITLKERG